MRSSWIWLSVALLLLLTAAVARANDAAISGTGGNVHLLKGHPTIRMVSEKVHIRLRARTDHEVVATFVFRNEGPASTVTMGFPERGHGDSVPAFRSFTATVDGRRVQVGTTPWQGKEERSRWRTKRVYFARGQTRVVQDRYRTFGGGVSTGQAWIEYVLKTGASWKGPIGSATVVVDASELRDYGPLRPSPEGYARRGHQITWRWRNVEPVADVSVGWDPLHWWRRVCRFDPTEPLIRSIGMRAQPRLVNGSLMVPARLLPVMMDGHAQVRWRSGLQAVEITSGKTRLLIPVPGSRMTVDGRPVRLPFRTRIIAGRAMVPLRAVAEAAGWRVCQGERHYPRLWLEPAGRGDSPDTASGKPGGASPPNPPAAPTPHTPYGIRKSITRSGLGCPASAGACCA